MLQISESQAAQLLDHLGTAEAIARALADLARGLGVAHRRQHTRCGDDELNTTGGIWTATQTAGLKIFPTPSSRSGVALLIYDLADQQPAALLEARELTVIVRAALASMVSVRLLAGRPHRLALFGAGAQGFEFALALSARLPLESIALVAPGADPGAAGRMQAACGVPVQMAEAATAVRAADIVVNATEGESPLFRGTWLKPDAFVAALGGGSTEAHALDPETLHRASQVLVESASHSFAEAGDLRAWRQRGGDLRKLVELAACASGQRPWPAPRGITVLRGVGIGLLDVAAGQLALSRARSGWLLRDETSAG